MADRRTTKRFEIVGRLPVTLAAERRIRLLNVSQGGALVETALPLRRDDTLNVDLDSDERSLSLRARVCYIRLAPEAGRYLVGLEFLGSEAKHVDRLLGTGSPDDAPGS